MPRRAWPAARGRAMAADRLTVVGRSVPRLDARDKVMGTARYVSDLAMPGMVHARLWRAPVPHARILAVGTARAAAAPVTLSRASRRSTERPTTGS